MWSICPECGAIVADTTLHADWHAALTPTRGEPDPEE